MAKRLAQDDGDIAKPPRSPRPLTLAEACLANDRSAILLALHAPAKAYGISRLSRESVLSRPSLHKTLSATGNPGLSRLVGIVEALGFSLSIKVRRTVGIPAGCLSHRKAAVEASGACDYAAMLEALGRAGSAYGMSQLSRETQLRREALYDAYSISGDPRLGGLLRVLDMLGMSLSIARRSKPTGRIVAESLCDAPV